MVQQLIAAYNSFKGQRIGDHMQGMVRVVDQALPIQGFQVGLFAGPFLRDTPGPALFSARVTVDLHWDFLRQAH